MSIDLKKLDFRKTTEKLLYGCAFLIIVCHLLLASFQYVIPYREYRPYILWPSLIFFIAVGIYTVASMITPATRTDMLTTLKKYFSFEQVLLLIIFLWLILSIYLNGKREELLSVYFRAHDWSLFDTFICMFVLFPLPRLLGKDRSKQLLEALIHIVVIFYSIFTVYCLWHIFHLEALTFPSGQQAGITEDFQLMLGFHPNTTGMIAATMFCLCVYMIVTQEWIVKILYTVLGFANLLVVYLSNSRTPFLAVVIFLAFTAFWLTWLALKDRSIFLKILFSIAVAAIIFLFFWKARTWTFLAFENITHYQEALASEMAAGSKFYSPSLLVSSTKSQPIATALATTYGEGNTRNLDGLSGRENVWRTCIRIMTANPFNFFFGVSPAAVSDSINTVGRFPKEIAHAHNSILQIGVSIGVPMMAAYVVFLFQMAVKSIRILFSKTDIASEIILPGFLLSFLFLNMAEAYLFAYFSIISCFFYLVSGIVDMSSPAMVPMLVRKKSSLIVAGRSAFIYLTCLLMILAYADRFINLNSNRIPGSGLKEDPYLIEDKSDLCYFRDLVNHGNFFEACYFLQTKDIDLEGIEWEPIGTWGSSDHFDGVYDGGCHVIKNLNIPYSKSNDRNEGRVALFGYLYGTVKNLGIESGSISGYRCGSIASIGDGAVVINCYNRAEIIGTVRAGGVCDHFRDGIVVNCLNEGDLSAPVTASVASWDAKLIYANAEDQNTTETFKGTIIPITFTGDTLQEKLNSGLDSLIDMKVLPSSNVRYWG